jgi:hypothetical protein
MRHASQSVLSIVAGTVFTVFLATPASAQPVYNANDLTFDEFQVLPDDAVIEFDGHRFTKHDVLVAAAKAKEHHADRIAKEKADFEAAIGKLRHKQEEDLEKDNARIAAQLAKVRAAGQSGRAHALAEIREEYEELVERARHAGQQELEEIDEEAVKLLVRLRTLDR